jgi:ribonucleotide reductase alpha subunit
MPIANIAAILTAVNAAECLMEVVSGYTKCQQVAQQEQTKRREIVAQERTASLGVIASAYTEYKQVAEQEQTKRREIEAWEKETITKINAQRDLLMAYLERSFDERSENFRSLFKVVDQAITAGNNEQLALALHSITGIAKSSPFKDLGNLASVRSALDDPDHEWKF